MLREDNSGFVRFPIDVNFINKTNGKTLVYLVAFDSQDLSNVGYELSNIRISKPSNIVYDDIQEIEGDDIYFPKLNKDISIPMTSCICIGWSNFSYETNDEFWSASFRDLTNEGRKLYYSIKKLHNNKEVRILTFSGN